VALLSCSSSLALMLLAVNPTNPSRPISPNRSIEPNDEIQVNPEINQDKSQSSLPEINSEKIGNLTTITLGCECAGCREQVLQMIQQGRLTLPLLPKQ
jgi:hypothetical protein